MRRAVPILSLIAAFQVTGSVSPAGAANMQSQSYAQHFYSVGDRWCYRHYEADGALSRTSIKTVTHVGDGEVQVQRIDKVGGSYQQPTVKIWKIGKGYRGPLQVGDAWSEPASDGDTAMKVVGAEVLSTRIGRVATFRIEANFTRDSENYHQIFWYSPAIGEFVRLYYVGQNGPDRKVEISCFKPGRRQRS